MILLKNRDRNPSFKKGEYVEINDAGNYPMELSVDGVCKQETTTGKNLIDSEWQDRTFNGVTITNNGDGTYTLNGTSTSSSAFAIQSISGGIISHPLISNIANNVGKYITISTGYSTNQNFYLQLNLSNQSGGGEQYGFITSVRSYTNKLINNEQSEAVYVSFFIGIYGNATFNNVKVYPMITIQDSQITTAPTPNDFEKSTGGQPSPNPDYPQEIKTITDSLSVTSCNKNLTPMNINSMTKGGITFTNNNDGSLTLNGTATSPFELVLATNFKLYAGTYTHSINKIFKGMYISLDNIGDTMLNGAQGKVKSTFKLSEGKTYNKYFIRIDKDTVFNNDTFYIQLEQNSIKTPFEQHLETQIQANLPEGEFIGKINDTYKDTLNVVYKDDGNYHLILNKMIGKIVLNGSETFYINAYAQTLGYNIFVYKGLTNSLANGDNSCKSNYFIHYSWGQFDSKDAIYQNSNWIMFKCDSLNIGNDIDKFKEWLSTHNTEVYYALATPYELDLGIVDTLLSYDEVTNVFTDSDLLPTINVKYYKDFEFDKILRSGYNIDEQEYEIAKKQMANGKRKRILSSYDDCIIKINLGLLDNKTYQEYKEQLNDGEFHYWSYKYNQYKKANFILTKPSITTEYAYDDDIGIDDIEITLEKSSDVS